MLYMLRLELRAELLAGDPAVGVPVVHLLQQTQPPPQNGVIPPLEVLALLGVVTHVPTIRPGGNSLCPSNHFLVRNLVNVAARRCVWAEVRPVWVCPRAVDSPVVVEAGLSVEAARHLLHLLPHLGLGLVGDHVPAHLAIALGSGE